MRAACAPDVMHAHGAKGGVYGRLAATIERRRGRRVAAFYAPHGGSLHYDSASLSGRVYFTVERALERLTDGLIHVSAYEAATYRHKVGVPRCPAQRRGERACGRRNSSRSGRTLDAADFLYHRHAARPEGRRRLSRTRWPAARAQGRAFRALVVGAGEPGRRAALSRDGRGGGLADRVTFLPPMPAREAFALARTVVVPSRAESMPYLVLEAAAAGRAAHRHRMSAAFRRSCRARRSASSPPGDPAALAEAMRPRARGAGAGCAAEAMLRRDRVRQKFSLADHGGADRRHLPRRAGTL